MRKRRGDKVGAQRKSNGHSDVKNHRAGEGIITRTRTGEREREREKERKTETGKEYGEIIFIKRD